MHALDNEKKYLLCIDCKINLMQNKKDANRNSYEEGEKNYGTRMNFCDVIKSCVKDI